MASRLELTEAERAAQCCAIAVADGVPMVMLLRPVPCRSRRSLAGYGEFWGEVNKRGERGHYIGGLFVAGKVARIVHVCGSVVYAASEPVPLARFRNAGGLQLSAARRVSYYEVKETTHPATTEGGRDGE